MWDSDDRAVGGARAIPAKICSKQLLYSLLVSGIEEGVLPAVDVTVSTDVLDRNDEVVPQG